MSALGTQPRALSWWFDRYRTTQQEDKSAETLAGSVELAKIDVPLSQSVIRMCPGCVATRAIHSRTAG